MAYLKKVVLYCPNGDDIRLDFLVEEFIRDGVMFVAVVGKDCSKVEDIIGELVVGDGSRNCYILTSFQPNESVEEAVIFAKSLTGEFEGQEVQIVEL
jgi:hypothetical protein